MNGIANEGGADWSWEEQNIARNIDKNKYINDTPIQAPMLPRSGQAQRGWTWGTQWDV
ncbi:hypothetical protein HETIRDRAFT_410089 [Heterobasidion irregulare TC 32-1]|uniref:Uncharacterized protein n=1 Tax=Heterobasidion irregulare (strain TC 32-1) TaxID=747525 RepID=W4K4X9_HETIT|nr:uncharacterized protein HETIRDRAFT_410089 [Heterobasidion irregulare TC 32-1]ETW80862.1 hypothetical protein HETIRDRAFT_410089 [Heterobasidion irregulare TC 32-1]